MMMVMNTTGSGMSMSMMKEMHNTGDASKVDLTISKPSNNQSVKIVDTFEKGLNNSLQLYNQTGNIVKR